METSITPAENSQPLAPETATVATAAPVAKADRIHTVDMIRGFALLGILLMNIPIFGLDESAFSQILKGSSENADFKALGFIHIFPDGTMRGLFSMLFGVGMVLFTLNKTSKPDGPTVAEYYYRRLLWLVLFGVFNAYILLWEGDILFYYGLAGMLLYPFRKSSPKLLIGLGILCFAINMYKTMGWFGDTKKTRKTYLEAKAAIAEKKPLTEAQQGAMGRWEEIEKSQTPDTARSKRNIRKMHSGYGTIFSYFIPDNANNEIWGMYHGIWDFIGMMLIGMGLFWMGFFSNKLATSTYGMLALVGYIVGITIGWLAFINGQVEWVRHFSTYIDNWRVPHFLLYDVRRVFISVGHASLLMLLYRSGLVNWLMRALANVGQMAFTNYLMQSIICTWFFFGYGFDYYNKLRFYQLYYVVLAIWIFQMIFSSIWLRFFRFGPFEWVWRSLTYWKKQPMRLKKIV
ncbi:MAG: DUF418 domain-containing protein [Bacteroidota bacterium]